MSEVKIKFKTISNSRVSIITLDRQSKLNAINTNIADTLKAAFIELKSDEKLRAVILRGAGNKAWVAGADINEMASLDSSRKASAFIYRLHSMMQTVRDLPVPVIAQINGFCLGAGMELAAACDLRLAGNSAKFGMLEVQVGLPSVIEASLLPVLMGRGRAARLVLTGEIIDARKASEWGFVEETVDDLDLEAAVNVLVSQICSAAPGAVRMQKKLLRNWEKVSPDEAALDSVKNFGDVFKTAEPLEWLGRVKK